MSDNHDILLVGQLLDRLDAHLLYYEPHRKQVITQMFDDESVLVSWDNRMGRHPFNGWCVKPGDTRLFEALWHIGLVDPPDD